MKLIEVKNVWKIYNEGMENEVRALMDVDLTIDRGEFVAIIGASGSGKSTLMNILGCLDIPTYGEYYLDNLIPALTALENVELPLVYQGVHGAKRHELAMQALEKVGLAERCEHHPYEMSGGQQQRVTIARAISTGAPIIMADEPTGALDSKTGKHVLEILHGLHEDGTTIILITHDNKIAATAERIVRISDGQIVQDCPREEAEL